MEAEQDFDEEVKLLQKSIRTLIATNREFIRILFVLSRQEAFKSKRVAMEIKAAFDLFSKAQSDLETLNLYSSDKDN
jgi:hypothetical protein